MKIRQGLVLASTLLAIYTCEGATHKPARSSFSEWFFSNSSTQTIHQRNAKLKTKANHNAVQIWDRIRLNYGIHSSKEKHQVQKHIKKYSAQEKTLYKHSSNAKPYLYHIVEQLEQRGMPSELALLPMIESAFQPKATSPKGAAGLWQFMPATGRQYGLKKGRGYDERRDLVASTRAALDYLEFLHKEFDHDWMLALAAYNSGEGTVQKAIKKNKRSGKDTSFWSLSLPKETQNYVPKLLALAEVIKNPDKHEVSLPMIKNTPYHLHAVKN